MQKFSLRVCTEADFNYLLGVRHQAWEVLISEGDDEMLGWCQHPIGAGLAPPLL